MRKLLLAAVASAPLALAMTPAWAQTTTISNSTSTPVATATAASGAPSDVDLASGGTITTGTTTPAITLNSNNNVTIEGTVSSDNVAGATGVLLLGGNTGNLTSTGTITVTEDFTASDSLNSDGIAEAPFASGSGRYGVRLTGTSPFNGSISLTGTQTVKGQNSYVVSLEAPVTGAVGLGGTSSLTGDNGAVLRETGGVGGSILLGSTTTVQGQNSSAFLINGDVGGAVRLNSTTTVSGYAAEVREADAAQTKIQATPTDVEQAGAGVVVGANVAGGVYFSAAPTGTVSGSTADLDGDGVADGSELSSTLTQYGSAPALLVGASGKAITLGAFGTGDAAYGLYIRGAIASDALIDNATATGVQIGTGDGQVAITGGVRVVGSVTATSYEANATGFHILSGAAVPAFRVDGVVSSIIDDSTIITTPTVATSTALLVDAGARLGSLTNTGTISGVATGDAMNAGAVIDHSGTLANVLNEGVISATVTPTTAGLTPAGSRVALDLSANTTGVVLTQQTNPNPNTLYGSTSGTDATAATTLTAVTPTIVGDVYLGSGPSTVNILAGSLTGALTLGSAAGSSLTIDNGATVAGAVTYAGPSLALNVNNGTLNESSATNLRLSSLNLGALGKLVVAVDGANGVATTLTSSGPATLAAGAAFGVNLLSLPAGATTYAIITAPTLTYGGAAGSVPATTSYLYDAAFSINPSTATAPGSVTLNLTRRTQAELGLTSSEYGSLDGVLGGTAANPNLLRAALQPADQASFIKTYDQLLPDHAGGVFLAAQTAAESIGHAALDARAMDFAPGAWVQEFVIGVEENRGQAVGAHDGGFGVAGGFETGASAFGQFGVTAAFANATIKNPEVTNDSQASFSELEGGVYWRAAFGGLQLAARASGGYLFGFDRRYIALAATDVTSAVSTADKATWNGYTLDGRFSAGYQVDLGKRWFVRPQLVGEYFRLDQDSYSEHGGGAGVDLAVDSRTGDSETGTASVVFGAKFGRDIVWRPTLELGARDVFSGSPGDTTAQFTSGGPAFTLVPNAITGVGGLARIGLNVGASSYEVYLDAEGQEYSKYRQGDVRTGVRVLF